MQVLFGLGFVMGREIKFGRDNASYIDWDMIEGMAVWQSRQDIGLGHRVGQRKQDVLLR